MNALGNITVGLLWKKAAFKYKRSSIVGFENIHFGCVRSETSLPFVINTVSL